MRARKGTRGEEETLAAPPSGSAAASHLVLVDLHLLSTAPSLRTGKPQLLAYYLGDCKMPGANSVAWHAVFRREVNLEGKRPE